MSPAILTETVWALARETPPVVPDRVVALTTRPGREQIRGELFQSGVWENLRKSLKAGDRLEFGDTGAHIRVITRATRELDDIRTPEDSAAAADFILHELRAFADNPDVRIIASIAGGRKTMSALLYACMSLVGRETDRVTHVLVSEKFEERRNPAFYYPHTAAEARGLQLADIPFVPLRNRFEELGEKPGTFLRLTARYSRQLSRETRQAPIVRLTDRGASVDGRDVPLRNRALHTLAFLVELSRKGRVKRQDEAEEEFRSFIVERDAAWAKNIAYPEDLKRELSYLRTEMAKRGVRWVPGLRRDSLRLPPFRLVK